MSRSTPSRMARPKGRGWACPSKNMPHMCEGDGLAVGREAVGSNDAAEREDDLLAYALAVEDVLSDGGGAVEEEGAVGPHGAEVAVVGEVEVGCVGDGAGWLAGVDEGDHEGEVDDVVVSLLAEGLEGSFPSS
eukprot:TRINITY_DN12183_c0_g1_i1.p2 TRINITY_DN12183_c0_g1~~TRINITY_DN12183_c0_g1_i1.p2  ORF type:complete len:133 (+),score=3.95 TRINITY_DN12183_c0_g1_i1:103-501(+)